MRKKWNRRGFTLMETLVTILIMALLAVGMDTGMNAAMRVYDKAVFFSDSSAAAGMLDTAIGDVLRYAHGVKAEDGLTTVDGKPVDCLFTNVDYGMSDAYLEYTGSSPWVYLKSENHSQSLLNKGAFPNDMRVVDFECRYSGEEGKFTVKYRITSADGALSTRTYTHTYLVLNEQ